MMDAKNRAIENLIGKLNKRILELDKDATRLSLINKMVACDALRRAIMELRIAIVAVS